MLLSHALALAACTASPVDDGALADGADTAGDTAPVDTAAPGDTALDLHGVPPATPVPPPTFAARNLDGAPRAQPDLVGHPTIVWFYPAATTAG